MTRVNRETPLRYQQRYATFIFPDGGTVPLDTLDAWWDEQEQNIHSRFVGFKAVPIPDRRRYPADAYFVAIPVPQSVIDAYTTTEVILEVLDEVKEACLAGIPHGRGSHSRCHKSLDCREQAAS